MVNVIEQLLIVQDVDARIRGVERELTDIPRRKEAEQTRLSSHKAALQQAESALKSRQAEAGRMELEGKTLEEKIAKLRRQQMELKTNKEFKIMEEEIAAVQGGIAGLEDRELELMAEIEAARGQVDERAKDIRREEEAILVDTKVLDERAGELRQELARCQAERAIAVADVPRPWLDYYDRIATRRKDHVVVPLENGTCGGCHMQMPPSVIHASRQRDQMTVCEYCNRLLYS